MSNSVNAHLWKSNFVYAHLWKWSSSVYAHIWKWSTSLWRFANFHKCTYTEVRFRKCVFMEADYPKCAFMELDFIYAHLQKLFILRKEVDYLCICTYTEVGHFFICTYTEANFCKCPYTKVIFHKRIFMKFASVYMHLRKSLPYMIIKIIEWHISQCYTCA
jgi:hypothetical protein